MTLITLPSGTVLANDFTLPIIVVSKVSGSNIVDVEIHSVTLL